MILVDTSVWIEFLAGRVAGRGLAPLLADDEMLIHAFVLGELTLGSLGRVQRRVLEDAVQLGAVLVAEHSDVIALVQRHRLSGAGIGWIDAHLLSAALIGGVQLWTSDR